MTLLADFMLSVATARHHSIESQTAGAEGATAVLTSQLRGYYNINIKINSFILPSLFNVFICVANIGQQYLTSFLKRLNLDAQQKQRLSIPTRVESHETGDYI